MCLPEKTFISSFSFLDKTLSAVSIKTCLLIIISMISDSQRSRTALYAPVAGQYNRGVWKDASEMLFPKWLLDDLAILRVAKGCVLQYNITKRRFL